MATVSTLLTNMGRMLNDPNAEIFTSAIKLVALNNAQKELVLRILAYNPSRYETITDLLTEIVEEESASVSSSGLNLTSGLTNRYMMRNGLLNSKITINNVTFYPYRLDIANLGRVQNRYLAGDNTNPICYVVNNKYYLDIDSGSLPITTTFYYVGAPYTLAAAASGSDRDQVVDTSDLNIIFHELLSEMSVRDLLRDRGDKSDFQEAEVYDRKIKEEIQSLVTGQITEPKARVNAGQYSR